MTSIQAFSNAAIWSSGQRLICTPCFLTISSMAPKFVDSLLRVVVHDLVPGGHLDHLPYDLGSALKAFLFIRMWFTETRWCQPGK